MARLMLFRVFACAVIAETVFAAQSRAATFDAAPQQHI